MNAHTLTTVGLYGLPLILPVLRQDLGVSLAVAGLIAGMPSLGALATLILWGALADRHGERIVLGIGVTGCAILLSIAATVSAVLPLAVLLVLAGASGAAAVVGGGRIVLRWFPPHERGTAMGLRQISYTLGVAIAAFALPPIAGAFGLTGAFVVAAALCFFSAVLAVIFVADPPKEPHPAPPQTHPASSATVPSVAVAPVAGVVPVGTGTTPAPEGVARPVKGRSPYRDPALWRVHAASAALSVPQFIVGTYGVSCLVEAHDWDKVTAGQVFGVAALGGVAIRLGVGFWSDRTGRRLLPLRMIAFVTVAVMTVLALGEWVNPWAAVVALLLASVITVSGNGLSYLAAGELAGPAWAGRVLGAHNTVQNLVSFAGTPLIGLAISAADYWSGFAVGAGFALLAVPLIPIAAERRAALDTRPRRPRTA
ncbi:MFS transporter [Microtetraspora sp. NBRC 13810]|uniref:MFS transporter n=1 Tax=Microtetraspora sp. NBRC 13810 TaxID=3030990 RepID=UPI0025545583|nr:MFS transporter [Microtetraspora sp. NBRC 13810]